MECSANVQNIVTTYQEIEENIHRTNHVIKVVGPIVVVREICSKN